MAGSFHNLLKTQLQEIIQRTTSPDGWTWLKAEAEAIEKQDDYRRFNTAFVMMPRRIGKSPVSLSEGEAQAIDAIRSGLDVQGWTIERLGRIWLILHLPDTDQVQYIKVIENLFLNAEMNESIALYSALPIYAFPQAWRLRCAEGIRNNIAQVLESIMCRNPYPAEQLDEQAWNQLVLKAIFTEKPLLQIQKLRERSNDELANSISMFAHERWAAGREVSPLVWICMANFVDEKSFADIQRLAFSTNLLERKAASLVCAESAYPPAKELLLKNSELRSLIEVEKLTWSSLQEDMLSAKEKSI